MNKTRETLQHLTATIANIQSKVVLRGTLEAELLKLGCPADEVTAELDELFKATKH